MSTVVLPAIKGVFVDGGTVVVKPTRQTIKIPRGTTARVPIACVKSDGTPLDLTGGTLILSAKKTAAPGAALISTQGAAGGVGGLSHFDFVTSDTSALTSDLEFDVDWISPGDGDVAQLCKVGCLIIEPAVRDPGAPVNVPLSEQPLAQGPPGPSQPGWQGWRATFTASQTAAVVYGTPYVDDTTHKAVPGLPLITDDATEGVTIWISAKSRTGLTLTASVPFTGQVDGSSWS